MSTSVVAAGGGIGGVVGGVAPNWGPFAALGGTAVTIIDVVMASVIVICMIVALVGASKQRVGSSSRNGMQAEEGKGLLISGVAGAFIVASLGTVFTVVYGLGI